MKQKVKNNLSSCHDYRGRGGGVISIFKHTFFGRGSSFVIVNSEGEEKKNGVLFSIVINVQEIQNKSETCTSSLFFFHL